MFAKSTQDMGVLKANKEYRIDFPYEDVDYIVSTNAPCDCTRVNNFVTEKKINIVFNPKFPEHLKNKQPSIKVDREVHVTYKDLSGAELKETLHIIAVITS